MKKIIIISCLIATIIACYFYFSSRNKKHSGVSNDKVVERFERVDDNGLLTKYSNLQDFKGQVLNEVKKLNLPINSIIKKMHVGINNQSISLVVISDLGSSKSLIRTFRYYNGMITTENYLKETIELTGFFGVCDDHYLHIKSKIKSDIFNYSYLFIKDTKVHFLNIKEDSLGDELSTIKGKCSEGLIKENIDYINKILKN